MVDGRDGAANAKRSGNEARNLGELLYWCYANLAMAHAAVAEGSRRYEGRHYAIRSRLYKGLCAGKMRLGSLLDEERLRMTLPQICSYCGARGTLSLDHLIPCSAGGPDSGDNIVWACACCNSAKGATDLLVWVQRSGRFPPLMVLRRYLKLLTARLGETGMSKSLPEALALAVPLSAFPGRFPPPSQLVLWAEPSDVES